MKKPLKFHELSEEAKKQAAENVYGEEVEHEDWSHLAKLITESVTEHFKGHYIAVGSIEWNTSRGVSLTAHKATLSHEYEFQKNALTEEEFSRYTEFEGLSYYGYNESLFSGGSNYSTGHDFSALREHAASKSFAIVNTYGTDEQKADVAFLELLNDDDSVIAMEVSETYELLYEHAEEIAEGVIDALDKKLNEKAGVIWEQAENIIRNEVDYYESVEYYYERLNECSPYLDEKYGFDISGEIIETDGEIHEEHMDEYEDYIDSKEVAA